MKNVFLVTWYKSENYGTFLQAYATNYILKQKYNVLLLERCICYPITESAYLIKKIIIKLLSQFKKNKLSSYGEYTSAHGYRIEKINSMINSTFNVQTIWNRNDIKQIDLWADCYLVGSDQMWNPFLISPSYLLGFVSRKSVKKKVSYATSFGVDNIPRKYQNLYRRYLSRFNAISVREPRAAELVKELSDRDSVVVLDPTLLLTPQEWRAFANQSTIRKLHHIPMKYVLCYFIGSSENNYLDTAKRIANREGAKIVLLPTKESDYMLNDDMIIVADACAYDFIDLIDNAHLVCTDSFHGTVFAFLMNTDFFVFQRFKKADKYSQDARLMNILNKFDLKNAIWEDTYIDDIGKHISYNFTYGHSVLELERKECIQYLLNLPN